MSLTRREFIGGALASAAPRTWGIIGGPSRLSPNYFCTWACQGAVKRQAQRGEIAFAGDQGNASQRDCLTERLVFGPSGWAGYYPMERDRLFFLLDDGWDVPTGINLKTQRSLLGALVPDAGKFPSLTGGPAARLRNLRRRLIDAGWRGLGLWVSPVREEEEVTKRKLSWCAEAGVDYLKVDWGSGASPRERVAFYRLKQEICPTLTLEHCACQGPDPVRTDEVDVRTRQTIASCDVWRIYDLFGPLETAEAIARGVADLRAAEAVGSRALINYEHCATLAACLGGTFGEMNAPNSDGTRKGMAAAVAWSRIASAFDVSAGTLSVSLETLSDRWTVRSGEFWDRRLVGRTLEYAAPAVVARGMELPHVIVSAAEGRGGAVSGSAGARVPFVCASRYPNGGIAVGTFPRRDDHGVYSTAEVDVRLKCAATTVGVFGSVASLSLPAEARRQDDFPRPKPRLWRMFSSY